MLIRTTLVLLKFDKKVIVYIFDNGTHKNIDADSDSKRLRDIVRRLFFISNATHNIVVGIKVKFFFQRLIFKIFIRLAFSVSF